MRISKLECLRGRLFFYFLLEYLREEGEGMERKGESGRKYFHASFELINYSAK